jgi:endonuclease YncB( thermonuclease family)
VPRLMRLGALLALVSIFALAPAAALRESFSGQVVGVTDGDTLKVLKNGREVVIRLYGVDAPETGQAFGTAARQFLSKKVFGHAVTVRVREKDRYGRSVGTVATDDGQDLSESLARNGYAWWYSRFAPMAKNLADAETSARAARVGLWSDPNPTPPWSFRHPASLATASARTRPKPTPLSSPRVTITPVTPAPAVVRPAPAPDPLDRTVYITRTGRKYHAAGCRYLSRSMIPVKLRDAIRQYDACSICGGG